MVLGSTVASNWDFEKELRTRIALAKAVFHRASLVWKSPVYSEKLRLFQINVLSASSHFGMLKVNSRTEEARYCF